jgi:hypothetical protein
VGNTSNPALKGPKWEQAMEPFARALDGLCFALGGKEGPDLEGMPRLYRWCSQRYARGHARADCRVRACQSPAQFSFVIDLLAEVGTQLAGQFT